MAKNKRGRRKIDIDLEEVKKLCELHCTAEEIASFFDIDFSTLKRRIQECGYGNFEQYYAKNVRKGKVALRRKQWDLAMDGDVKLLIWLGKQNLEQKEKIENENINPPVQKIEVSFLESVNNNDDNK